MVVSMTSPQVVTFSAPALVPVLDRGRRNGFPCGDEDAMGAGPVACDGDFADCGADFYDHSLQPAVVAGAPCVFVMPVRVAPSASPRRPAPDAGLPVLRAYVRDPARRSEDLSTPM
jgi:hypothetical protein